MSRYFPPAGLDTVRKGCPPGIQKYPYRGGARDSHRHRQFAQLPVYRYHLDVLLVDRFAVR